MFSYTYKVRLLGTFIDKGSSIEFTTAARKLPTVSYHARHLKQNEVKHILNIGNESGAEIGYLCIGEDIYKDKGYILFDVQKLRDKRTMIFAQSGFGKTNLVKVLLYHIISDTSYGKLIFDLNGGYFLKGRKTYGLGDINEQKIKDNLVVYSDKKLPDEYKDRFIYKGKVLINMHEHLTVGDILNFSTGFSEVMKSFLLYLEENEVKDFIKNINTYVTEPQQLHKRFPDFWDTKREASSRTTVAAIRKRVAYLIEEGKGLHSSSSKLIEDVMTYLKQGKTVVIDLSLRDSVDASIISTILVRKLFEHNKEKFTGDNPEDVINSVIFIEEAQNVLSYELVKATANPFVKTAKEGRKFGIGIVAITQRPSAISEEIRTQAENFFAFHLGNSDDIKALIKSNVNYEDVIANFLQRETIPGNLYMVSSEQAFALPIRVKLFEEFVENKVYENSKFANTPLLS